MDKNVMQNSTNCHWNTMMTVVSEACASVLWSKFYKLVPVFRQYESKFGTKMTLNKLNWIWRHISTAIARCAENRDLRQWLVKSGGDRCLKTINISTSFKNYITLEKSNYQPSKNYESYILFNFDLSATFMNAI